MVLGGDNNKSVGFGGTVGSQPYDTTGSFYVYNNGSHFDEIVDGTNLTMKMYGLKESLFENGEYKADSINGIFSETHHIKNLNDIIMEGGTFNDKNLQSYGITQEAIQFSKTSSFSQNRPWLDVYGQTFATTRTEPDTLYFELTGQITPIIYNIVGGYVSFFPT